MSSGKKNYVANDPRWSAHRQKMAAAQIAKRPTLSDEEISQVIAMRERGWSLTYIQKKLWVRYEVIIRELKARGLSPKRWHANRLTLCEEEIKQIVALRKKGRTFDYIAEEICVCREVIRRELKARGIPTAHIRRRRAKRGKGFWALFGDDPIAL
jgi:IS30 family transposase